MILLATADKKKETCTAVQLLTNSWPFFPHLVFSLQEFSNCLFVLFDQDSKGVLDQEDWFEMLRINTR